MRIIFKSMLCIVILVPALVSFEAYCQNSGSGIIKGNPWQRKSRRDSVKYANMSLENRKKAVFYDKTSNFVSLQLSALYIHSYDVTYERRYALPVGSLLTGLSAGYKPREAASGAYTNHNNLDINGCYTENLLMPYSESYIVSIPVRYMFTRSWVSVFAGVEPFARFTNYDHVTVEWNDQIDKSEIESYADSVKVNLNVIGGKVTAGCRLIYRLSDHFGIFCDGYFGLSAAYRTVDIFHYQKMTDNKITEKNTSEVNEDRRYGLCLGLRLGLCF